MQAPPFQSLVYFTLSPRLNVRMCIFDHFHSNRPKRKKINIQHMRQNKALYHKRPQSVGAIDLIATHGDQRSFAQYTKDATAASSLAEKPVYLAPEETCGKYPFMIPSEIQFPEMISGKNQPPKQRKFVYTVDGYQPKEVRQSGHPFSFPTIEFEPLSPSHRKSQSVSPRKMPHQRNKSEHSILSTATESPVRTPIHRQARSVFIPDLTNSEFQTPTEERQKSPLRNPVVTRRDLEHDFPPLPSSRRRRQSVISKTNTASSASRSSTISKPYSSSSATSNADSIVVDLTQEVEELDIKPKPEVIVIDDDEAKKDDALERIYSMYSKPQRERLRELRKISSSSADSTSSFRRGDESMLVRPVTQPLNFRQSVRDSRKEVPGKILSSMTPATPKQKRPAGKISGQRPPQQSHSHNSPMKQKSPGKQGLSFSGNLRNDMGHRRTKSNLVTLFETASPAPPSHSKNTPLDYYDYQQSPSYDFQTFIQARDNN